MAGLKLTPAGLALAAFGDLTCQAWGPGGVGAREAGGPPWGGAGACPWEGSCLCWGLNSGCISPDGGGLEQHPPASGADHILVLAVGGSQGGQRAISGAKAEPRTKVPA